MPALRRPSAHEDLHRRCFAFVDLGLRSTDTTLNDAFWFQVLELLLDDLDVLDAAYPFMTDETRDYVLEKLTDFGVPLTPPLVSMGREQLTGAGSPPPEVPAGLAAVPVPPPAPGLLVVSSAQTVTRAAGRASPERPRPCGSRALSAGR